MLSKQDKYHRRQQRNRFKLSSISTNRLRLSVFRSINHIYAQIIDDEKRKTLLSASSLDKAFRQQSNKGGTVDTARLVGSDIAERALKAGIQEVFFDRGAYLYHGRVKALAEGAREKGLKF